MDFLGITPQLVCEATGADATLVSRWRNGRRRLMPGRHWVQKISAYYIGQDAASPRPLLRELLQGYYPTQPLDTEAQLDQTLQRFLTASGQADPEYQANRASRMSALISDDLPVTAAGRGIEGAQSITLAFLDLILDLPKPVEFIFTCPRGLDLYMEDEAFSKRLMDRLTDLFVAGHRLTTVLRTDFKMSDAAAFSGRWLVAHLKGYIQSHYYDDFRKVDTDLMLAAVSGGMAMRITGSGEKNLRSEIIFDPNQVQEIYQQCGEYLESSTSRFQYNFFPEPKNYLAEVAIRKNAPCYIFSRLPHFGLMDAAQCADAFSLSEAEVALIEQQFAPFLKGPAYFSEKTSVRYVFCEDDIEHALLKGRHICREYTQVTGRRVLMTAPKLALQLERIRGLLAERKNYEVCFLRQDAFDQMEMQLSVWGSEAAAAWISGGNSACCKDYTNTGVLHGFCATVWDNIPGAMKTRSAANRKLALWLKKAEKYGYLG